MNNESFVSVFECHPNVQEIYVVDDMPFLEPGHAQSHAVSTGKPVKSIKRSDALKAAQASKNPLAEKETKKGKQEDPAPSSVQKDDATEVPADPDPSVKNNLPAKPGKKGGAKK